jgi:hypothetical protein
VPCIRDTESFKLPVNVFSMMPPPLFTFLKNFHNHEQKNGKPPAPTEPATNKPHKLRRKPTKSGKGQTHHQVASKVSTTVHSENEVPSFHPQTLHQHDNQPVSPTQVRHCFQIRSSIFDLPILYMRSFSPMVGCQ